MDQLEQDNQNTMNLEETMKSLTVEEINALVVSESYTKMGKKTTVCLLTLKNGFEVLGFAGTLDPENFDLEIGKKYVRENAINKVWELAGYQRQEELFKTLSTGR